MQPQRLRRYGYICRRQKNKNFEFSSEKLNDFLQNKKTIKISPQKGFVIKTYEKEGGKVYFNICSSNLIAEFHLKKIPDLNNEEGLRIPLSIGEEKIKEDKKGNKYKTYDIVLNRKVVAQTKKNEQLKKIIAELVQVAIKNKYKTETCTNLFFFPDHKYKGSHPDDQFIKDDQQHKFNIVEENGEEEERRSNKKDGNEKRNNSECDNVNNSRKGNDLRWEENIENYLTVKKPEWDMWFVNRKVLEEKHRAMNKFYLPYIRMFPLDEAIDCFDFRPPFLNTNKKKESEKRRKNDMFKSFLNEYNIEMDDQFLSYEQVINTICVIQIKLPFFLLAERNKKNQDDLFSIERFVNTYISDEYLSVFFKKSPLFPLGYNPPYKNFNIRFPFYFESSKAISQYLEKYHLLNIILPVSKNSASSIIFREIIDNSNGDVSTYDSETSDNSIF
ncbi:PIH1 domain-containing protein, putative (PIH1) [Plasmodium ovale wallikeri]|uniref:PIH1 domain-containing protein, putative (PIH1) n=1 Tax=Plasmodium ovale wallikeri TaxID=864142 RepID=A0A1A9A1N5_PLAOA|nr:PIH1 domain-containing protein, putative (PIH1) [Plasmodium ovale wallikeri]SBT50061.1 PIH1 domain-containing protein, putative (PIH1) [Plasmodium ovale wallikeri]